MSESTQPYAGLEPEVVLDAVESQGWQCNGRLLALNSYENRVYQIGIEEGPTLVAKFYRPQRWDDAAILEEHAFSHELVANDVPVAAPLRNDQGDTLFRYDDYRFALFQSVGGRHAQLDNDDHLRWLGRYLARIHMVGRSDRFEHRPRIEVERMAVHSYQYVLEQGFVPEDLQLAYRSVAEDVVARLWLAFDSAYDLRYQRLHGDCHAGNIMWTDNGPVFVDLDDCLSGPVIQDLWMFLSGDRHEQERQLSLLMEGYHQFADFDPLELNLIEPLRAMRMMHYSAWLARRWNDPAFPQAFPWFAQPRYWEEQILTLREQLAAFDEPGLSMI
jgi:Ser/Thr protein kinase RdoA (MazF antagonist)